MSICQVGLLHLCRAKLAKEAAQRDPRLGVVVGHSNLLDSLISSFADKYYDRRTWYVEVTSSQQIGVEDNELSSNSKESLSDGFRLAEDEVVLDRGNAEEVVIISKPSTYLDKISFRGTRNCTSLDSQGNDDANRTNLQPVDNAEQCFLIGCHIQATEWISDNTIVE